VHPRNAQAVARHSTIDLTMNVYTHVAMGDLHDDVEALPGMPGNGSARRDGNAVAVATAEPALLADAPNKLAALISSWEDLPANVRSAIAALALH
jgi:hypothetical protein